MDGWKYSVAQPVRGHSNRISPFKPDRAFAALARNFQRQGERFFGRAFEYEQEVLDERRCFVNVRRCFFNEVFRANDALELTSVLCPLDNVVLDGLASPRYKVKFERPAVIGFGDDKCRFQFTSTRT